MKKILITLIIMVFAAPILVFADGKTDFLQKCNGCHGGDAKAIQKRATMFKVEPEKLYLPKSEMDKAQMMEIIGKGKGKMPVFEGKLTKDQIEAVVDYVKTLK